MQTSEWYVPPSPELGKAAVTRGQEMDASLGVYFGMHPVLQHDLTKAEGRPIYQEELYLKIVFPGDKLSIVHRPVRPEDKHRFAAQWHAYETGTQGQLGTPLEKCPLLALSEVEELKYFNVRTCEELVKMQDGFLSRFPGIRPMLVKVQDFLDAAKGAAQTLAARAEVEKRDAEIAELKAKMAEVLTAMEAQKASGNDKEQHKRK